MAEPYVRVHAVIYDMTDDGPKIREDQVVTAETDERPKDDAAPERPARRVPRHDHPERLPDLVEPSPPAADEKE